MLGLRIPLYTYNGIYWKAEKISKKILQSRDASIRIKDATGTFHLRDSDYGM
jgi:hypothetical protein